MQSKENEKNKEKDQCEKQIAGVQANIDTQPLVTLPTLPTLLTNPAIILKQDDTKVI